MNDNRNTDGTLVNDDDLLPLVKQDTSVMPLASVGEKLLSYQVLLTTARARYDALLEAYEKETEWLTKRIKNMEQYLELNAPSRPGDSIVTDDVAIYFKHTERVEITAEQLIPIELCRIKQEPDKVAIKEKLKAGEEVPGAQIYVHKTLQVEYGGERARVNAASRAKAAAKRNVEA
jgi:hypothetical protein